MICPLNYNVFKSRMTQSNKLYTEEDIIMLYKANETLKKERHIGGNLQHGGMKCLTLHNIYKYSLGILLFTGGIYCGIFKQSEVAKTILTFVEMCRTAFAEEQFKHIWDIVGKTQLGFGFMERVTKYILEVFKKPEEGITMTWLKNLFELLCEVEDTKKVENIEQKLKDIVILASSELQEQQQQQPQPPQMPTKNENIVYDGKILTIQMGDAMITISPNIFKSRNSRNSSSYLTPKGGIKTKTKKKKTGKKRRL
jgi:hypothetical protein